MPKAVPAPTTTRPTDPFASHIARLAPHPVPLIATHYDIAITGGLARVTATRRFRNAESKSIEATLTFPVPIGAVLYRLEADVNGRTLKAISQARKQARETYEAALERGKTSVLHEELLPGIHMLSVGHITPGTDILVTAGFVMPLAHAAGTARLRIPLTVGDVYGRSGLPDSDELTHGGAAPAGSISITHDAKGLQLGGVGIEGAAKNLPLAMDAPIDIDIETPNWGTHTGRWADGRAVSLRIEPAPERDTPVDAVLLLDHSGSMASAVSGAGAKATKHAAALLGLSEAAGFLRDGDSLSLWEFDDAIAEIGTARNRREMLDLLANFGAPRGGTEIGAALARAAAAGKRDVVLITDGLSHALDVQALARTGCRFSVVLVGEDSLEANVGRLAALTGGALFVAFAADIASAISGAVAASRLAASEAGTTADGAISRRAGVSIGIATGKVSGDAPRTDEEHAIAALAACLTLPRLDEPTAQKLALAEGLVTHLTSLVLVDEDSATSDDMAENRKVALPSPRTARTRAGAPRIMFALGAYYSLAREAAASSAPVAASPAPAAAPAAAMRPSTDLLMLAATLPWNARPQRLIEGDVSVLPRETAEAIRNAAKVPWLIAEAKRLGIDPLALILGLMARSQGARDRMAARVARGILKSASETALDALAVKLGLPVARSNDK